jgi:uncharacterized protein
VLTVDSFYSYALGGKLVGLKCANGHVTTPPRHSCSVCKSDQLAVVELSGMGEVISHTIVYVKSQEFPLDMPFVLALVRLNEGPKLLGVLRANASEISSETTKMGKKVRVNFEVLNSPSEKSQSRWPRIFFETVQ